MMWRAMIGAMLLTFAVTPASAQWLGPWEDEPFWDRDRPRNAYPEEFDDFEDFEDEPPARRRNVPEGPEVMDGGARPDIAPRAPQSVAFAGSMYGVGTIVIDSAGRKLYYVTSSTSAYRYPISVGRVGFSWTGSETISRKANWPDWHPPEEMRQRDPSLPKKMTGGVRNPLGAVAMYLGNSLYRIHGTNDAKSLGQAASSGCFRMMNAHALHLAGLANVGTKVVVVKRLPQNVAGGGGQS